MNAFAAIFLTFFSLFLHLGLSSQEKVNDMTFENLIPYIYPDKENLNPVEFLNSINQNPVKQRIDEIKTSSSVIFWYVLNITKRENKFLEIYCPNTIGLQLFSVNEKYYTNGSLLNLSELKSFSRGNEYFTLRIPELKGQIIMKLTVSKYKQFSISIYDEIAFFIQARIVNSLYSFALGITILLFLYHLILYFKVKENLYLYYLPLAFFSGLFVLLGNQTFLLHYKLPFDEILKDLYCISVIVLTIVYLKIKNNSKREYRILIFFIILITFLRFLEILKPSLISNILVHSEYILLYSFILILSGKHAFKNHKQIKLFVLPWFFIIMGQVVFTLYDFKLVSSIAFYKHSFEIGLLLNLISLSFIFGAKLNIYKIQKNQAELSEYRALLERDKIILQQNEILEKLIFERNMDILNKIEILAKQKEEIELQKLKINQINKELNVINEKLHGKNYEIAEQNLKLERYNSVLEEKVNKRTVKWLKEKSKSENAEKFKSSFLNNLDQEINTPMNAISGYSTLLNDTNLTKEQRNKYLVIINSNIEILLEEIDNMVLLARLNSNAAKPKFSQFSIDKLFVKFKDYFDDKIFINNRIYLEVNNIENKEEKIVSADYDKIWHILLKILSQVNRKIVNAQVDLLYHFSELELDGKGNKHYLNINLIISSDQPDKSKLDAIIIQFDSNGILKNNSIKLDEINIRIANRLIELLDGRINIIDVDYKSISFEIAIPVKIINN